MVATLSFNSLRRARRDLRRAKLPTLYNRRLQEIAVLNMYNVKHGLTPESVSDLFVLNPLHTTPSGGPGRKILGLGTTITFNCTLHEVVS